MKLVTFPNMGNTCYINSVLQCFLYNPYFQKYCAIPELRNIIAHIDLRGSERKCFQYNLLPFINFFFEKKTNFKRFEQSDAHEFLMEFLDILMEGSGNESFESENEHWDSFMQSHKGNPFIKYYGQSKLHIKCNDCKKSKDVFEEYNTIHLPVSGKCITSLFMEYLKKETINDVSNLYQCDTCNAQTISDRKITLSVLPDTLILILKRYSQTGTKIEYEIKLDKTLHIKNKDVVKEYTLQSVVNHYGNLYDGHYTANVFLDNEWFSIDDNSITGIDSLDTSNAYILFYSSVNITLPR